MTTAATMNAPTRTSAVLDDAGLDASLLPAGPAMLTSIRRQAMEAFNRLGIPTTRDENWKYTSLKPLLKAGLSLRAPEAKSVTEQDIRRFALPDVCGVRLVFINGRLRRDLSTVERLEPGVSVMTLAEALQRAPELVTKHLARHNAFEQDAFSALNTALFDDATVIHFARDVIASEPITLLNVSSVAEGAGFVTHPRLLIVAEESSRGLVIEDQVSLGDGPHLTNAVTEVNVGPDADISHCYLARENGAAFDISTLTAVQGRNSRFASHSMLLGGAIVRNNVNPILDGENGHGLLNGLYVGRGAQHLDNHMRVEHRKPHCDSRQYYRGILADQSHGVFTGRIIVSPGAQKTDAVQSSQNLLLSDAAQAQTRPQLEIYADDVKCTHGATIGRLDEDALFYLLSRGVSRVDANALLVYAFAGEMLGRIEHDALRRAVTHLVIDRLPDSGNLHETVG